MGLYDEVDVYAKCPYCGEYTLYEAQTKDLGRQMYHYQSLDSGEGIHTDTKNIELIEKFRDIRKKLHVFKRFPKDKVGWDTQYEKMVASATVPTEYGDLESVEVTIGCSESVCNFDSRRQDILTRKTCSGFGMLFKGKIKLIDGMLVGDVYDITKISKILPESKLKQFKEVDRPWYEYLKKKYSDDYLIVIYWNKGYFFRDKILKDSS